MVNVKVSALYTGAEMAKLFASEAAVTGIMASFGAEAAIPVFGEFAMGFEALGLGLTIMGKKIK